jgi:hypothetical protein
MIVDIPRTVVKPAPVPTLAFVQGEWRAFQNGILCSLLGHDEGALKTARESWSRPHRWAWDTGFAVMEKLTRRADVQLALTLRFGGMEE